MADGQITRKDIIQEEAVKWGAEYAKNLQIAIDKNKEFVEGILQIKKANDLLIGSEDKKAYIESLKLVELESKKAIASIKEQEVLEISLQRIKQQTIATTKAEIDLKQKEAIAITRTEDAKKRSVGISQEQKLINQQNVLETKRQIIASGALGNAYKELSAKVAIAGDRLKNIVATGRLASESQNQYNKRLNQAQVEYDKLNNKVRSADAAVGSFNRNVGNYPKVALTNIRNLVSAFGVIGGIALFAKTLKDAARTVVEFEEEVVNLAAIAGLSRKEIAPLEKEIREVAKTSINTATDVAKLTTALIKLGSSPEEAMKLLKPINDLSIAMRADAEEAAELTKGLLNAYGEDASQASRVTDVLAASANKSALSFQGLRDSFGYVAPAARALGYSIEETASFLSILVDNNIKAESAGRLLSTSFARLAKQGLSLESALDQVNQAQTAGKTNLEVLALASKLFGVESGKIGLILANNREKFSALTDEYNRAGGSLKELVDKQLESASAKIKIMSSAWQEFVLSVENGNGPISKAFGALLDGTSKLLNNLAALNDSDYDKGLKSVNSELEKLEGFRKDITAKGILRISEKELAETKAQIDALKEINVQLKESAVQTPLGEIIPNNGVSKIRANTKALEDLTKKAEGYRGIIDGAKGSLLSSTKPPVIKDIEAEASAKAEADKKYLAAQRKRLLDLYNLNKKFAEDEFKLNQFRLQNLIDLNNEIISNEKSTIDDRILAIDENNQVLIKKNNEAAQEQFKLLGKYNEDTGKFIRELSNAEIQDLIVNGKKKVDITKEQLLILETLQATQTKTELDSAKARTDAIDKEVAAMKRKVDAQVAEQNASQNKELTTANDNFINDVDAAGDNFKLLEEAQRRHEKAIFDIKKSYALQAIDLQIDTFQNLIDEQEKLPESERISGEKIKEIVQDLADFRRQRSDLGIEEYKQDVDKKIEIETELNERLKDLAFEIGYALQDFANTLFDARLANIDNEIRANDEYYNKQIELAGNDALQKELLQEEAEKKRAQLEKKKREEQRKQAIFNKVVALAEIAINTAIAVSKAAAQTGILAPLLIPAIIALGAVQAATVLATPIPKYKDGLLSSKSDHLAIVGDGGRHEVIEKADGRSYMTPKTDTFALIERKDRVHKSIEDFEKAKRASFMLNLQRQGKEASSSQFSQQYGKEILKEMRDNTNAIKNSKQKIIFNAPKGDNLADELRRQRNTNWRA